MTARIRAARQGDEVRIARMVDEAWRATYSPLFPESFWGDHPVAQRADELRASLRDTSRVGLVAEADGAVVGWALRGPSRSGSVGIEPARETELHSLYAHPPGLGLGQRLLDAILGHEPAELWVFEANERAQQFYRRNGFRPEGARHLYGPDTARVPEIRMFR